MKLISIPIPNQQAIVCVWNESLFTPLHVWPELRETWRLGDWRL